MKRNWYGSIGSVSSGTLRTQDLLESFIWECKNLRLTKEERKEVSRITRLMGQDALSTHPGTSAGEGFNTEYARACKWQCSVCGEDVDAAIELYCGAQDDLETLSDILNNHALPYFYFGSHPADGACFGWFLPEGFENDFDDLRVSNTSEVPTGFTGEVLHVSDHGNATLYSARNGRLHEVWAVV